MSNAASSSSSSSVAWSDVRSVIVSNAQIQSDFSPAVVGFASRVYYLWVDQVKGQGSKNLRFAVLNDTGNLGELVQDRDNINTVVQVWGRNESAMAAPAMAVLNGTIHAVYPDPQGRLVHLQYDEAAKMWGRRCLLGVTPSETPGLASYKGQLVCGAVTSKDATSSTLTLLRWSIELGWSAGDATILQTIVKPRLTLFELNARLGLVFADGTGNGTFLQLDDAQPTVWTTPSAKVLEVKTPWGFGASCINDLCFVAYASDQKVAIKQNDQGWKQDLEVPGARTNTTPTVAILDNRVYCFWVDDKGSMRYMARAAFAGLPQLNEWMRAVEGTSLLSALSLPGIHDAGAAKIFGAVSLQGIKTTLGQCQSITIARLLEAGIRYIDLRAGYMDPTIDSTLIVYHNFLPMAALSGNGEALTIRSVFQDCYTFLETNKLEALVVQIKQDHEGNEGAASRPKFATDMQKLIAERPDRWVLTENVPKLNDIRGKIQLIRRFPIEPVYGSTSKPYGINVSDKKVKGDVWKDNVSFKVTTDGGVNMNIQDVWRPGVPMGFATIPGAKFDYVRASLDAAYGDPDMATWYLNFASANVPLAYTGPAAIANGWTLPYPVWGVNYNLDAYLNAAKNRPGRYGTILMDFPQDTPELINAIVKLNKRV